MAIHNRIASWKSNLLSYGGRLVLVKSVLSALPLHYAQVFRLPKWVIKHIDRQRRKFLWKGNEQCKPINCLVNWEKTCSLKQEGGLGIIDIADQNAALLVKWLWKLHNEENGLWAKTLLQLYGLSHQADLGTQGSYFLKSLAEFSPLFNCSVTLDQNSNRLTWKWTEGGFTTASAYKVLHRRGVRCKFYKVIWKLRIPMKVRIFVWLLINDRLLTREVLIKRGCSVRWECVMCTTNEFETRDHLFWNCNFARAFWMGLFATLNIRLTTHTEVAHEGWWKHRATLTGEQKRRWDGAWAAGIWTLWKERNRRIFSQDRKQAHRLINEATEDTFLWATHS